MEIKREVWLRGIKTEGIDPLLQPAVDALLQAREEIIEMLQEFKEEVLWERPAGLASVGFHLKHISGFLDRLLSYAEGKALSGVQLTYLKKETETGGTSLAALLETLITTIEQTTVRYSQFTATDLTKPRKVGRAGLPSTVSGLCFHAAEHTMRHTGQLLVTVVVLKNRMA